VQGRACARWVRDGRVIIAACLVWSVAVVWNACVAAGFQPSETVFPDTTRAWLSIPDPRGLHERFDASTYGQLVADPAMKPFIDGLKEQISRNGRQRLEKLGLTLEDFEGIPGGELAVAAIESQPGQLATVLIVDTTGHEAAAKALVEKITSRLVERKSKIVPISGAPPQLTAYQIPDDLQDDRVPKNRRVAFALAPQALVVGDDAIQVGQAFAVLGQGRKDSLASTASFTAVTQPCQKALPAASDPVRWYVDPLAFAKAYQAANPPKEKRKGPDYVAILGRQGFDAVKGAGGVIAFGEGPHALRHHTMIFAPPLPGREPQAADCYDLAARMLRFPNVDGLAPPDWVPRDVTGWSALQWDIKTAFASAETLVDDVIGEKGVFDDVMSSLKEDVDGPQIDVENDLVARLGSRVSMLTDSIDPIGTDSDRLVIAIEAADEAAVAAAIAKVMDADSDMRKVELGGHVAWELIDHSAMVPQLEIETPGGAVVHADDERRHNPDDEAHRRRARLREKDGKLLPHASVAVAKGHLFIASHRDVLERVLSAGGGDALASTQDSRAALVEIDRLLPGPNSLRSFGREADTVRPAYEMLRQGSMPKSKSVFGQLLNGILGDGKPGTVREQRLDGSTLPDFEQVRRYFGTAAMGMQSRPDGWFISGMSLPPTSPEVATKPTTTADR
jgi:hypothetical protein